MGRGTLTQKRGGKIKGFFGGSNQSAQSVKGERKERIEARVKQRVSRGGREAWEGESFPWMRGPMLALTRRGGILGGRLGTSWLPPGTTQCSSGIDNEGGGSQGTQGTALRGNLGRGLNPKTYLVGGKTLKTRVKKVQGLQVGDKGTHGHLQGE